ncbi:MAG: CvpA family protein [Clostridia bacterium]|nr:CvpA family protein [Clostridia bacterium]
MSPELITILLNVAMVVAILLPALRGYGRGFVKMTLHLFRFVIAFVLSSIFAKPLGILLKDKWLGDKFYNTIYEALHSSVEQITGGESMVNALPAGIRAILETFGVDVGAEAESAVASGEAMIETFSASIADKLSSFVGVAIAFIGLFLISLLVLSLFSGLLSALVEKLPLIGTVNKLLGFAFGALIGVIVAWLLAQLIVTLLVTFTEVDYSGAVLLNFFHDISPIRWLLQLLSGVCT